MSLFSIASAPAAFALSTTGLIKIVLGNLSMQSPTSNESGRSLPSQMIEI